MNYQEPQSITEPDPGQGAYGEDQFRVGFGGLLMAHGVTTIGLKPDNAAPPWSWLMGLLLTTVCAGCAAPGARQGTIEAVTRTDLAAAVTTIVETRAELTSEVTAAVQAVGVDLSERISQTSQSTQEAVVAYQRVDQSTGIGSKELVAGGAAVSIILLAVAVVAYPIQRRLRLGREKAAELARLKPK